jgi:hypothetical protein
MRTTGRVLRLTAVVVTAALALSAPAAAHRLSGAKARAQVEKVEHYVAGVLSIEYRVNRSGIDRCSNQGDHQVSCSAHWDVTAKDNGKRWYCTAEIRVWYRSERSTALAWDYRRLRCSKTRA